MITLGIDLASQDALTGLCRIEWSAGQARVIELTAGAGDERILASASGTDRIGIDAPLGWPVAFAEAVHQHSSGLGWPASYDHGSNRAYRYRRTDLWAWQLWSSDASSASSPSSSSSSIGPSPAPSLSSLAPSSSLGPSPAGARGGPPLSVSTDRIGIPAMRAVALLGRLPDAPMPIDGSGRVVEAYPAGALRRWGFSSRGYKGPGRAGARRELVASFRSRTSSWLTLDADGWARCRDDDNVFDALLTALIARAAALDLTEPVPPGDRELARREGWIAIPVIGSLDRLA